MKVDIPRGKYVLAVSGGVDSTVLLDILRQKPGIELIVVHFNHGIRTDSGEDEQIVRQTAEKYGLKFEVGRAQLGKNAGEAIAREARYRFLEKVSQEHGAKAIVTAHHRDDLIETALLNTLRGTKRKGLTALADNLRIIRPLLKYDKDEILAYAKRHKLEWREDSTNQDERYLRNYIRAQLNNLPKFQIKAFTKQLEKTKKLNHQIDKEVAIISHLLLDKDKINRQRFALLPLSVSREVVRYWLSQTGLAQADRKMIDRAMTFIKTGLPAARMPIGKDNVLKNSITHTALWKDKR